MQSKQDILDLINQATGTTMYHRYSSFPGYPVVTDGVIAVAEAAECFWFLDIIGSYQTNKDLDPEFQVWTLEVFADQTAIVAAYNDTELIITQDIPYTDFPLEKFKVYLIQGVILLPGEY